MASRKLICLEFNELCPSLLDRWMGEGKLPNFRRFYQGSSVFTAVAEEENPANLEPWIQWYSLHTGRPNSEHRVFHLTDGPKAGHNDVWRMLMDGSRKVFNCGSMNAKQLDSPGAMFLPDPWCTSEKVSPSELEPYQKFISSQVQENSAGGENPLSKGDALRFLWFMATHGLSFDTVKSIVSQLVDEKTAGQDVRWRRAALLDRMQSDVFAHYWRGERPDFSTFFLNSTAHFQHAYWHCAFPDQFEERAPQADIDRFQGAIFYGYQMMDRLLERFFALEQEGATLMLTTALSQHANTGSDMMFYRPRDVQEILGPLGVKPIRILPVMAEQFSARFATQAEADAAHDKLASLRTEGGRQVFDFSRAPALHVFFGCGIRAKLGGSAVIEGLEGQPKFFDVFRILPSTKSGRHHPDSVLWMKAGQAQVHNAKVSILDILPTILDFFGVDIRRVDPQGELRGTSLLPAVEGRAPVRSGVLLTEQVKESRYGELVNKKHLGGLSEGEAGELADLDRELVVLAAPHAKSGV